MGSVYNHPCFPYSLAMIRYLIALACLVLLGACSTPPEYDVIIRNGVIYNGSGSESYKGDLAINGDTIAAVGSLGDAVGRMNLTLGAWP